MGSTIRLKTLPQVAANELLYGFLVRLMMCCNDITLCNSSLQFWSEDTPKTYTERRTGAMMYFVRLQIAHLCEGIKLVNKKKNDETFLNALSQCDRRTSAAYEHVLEFMNSDDLQMMKKIRDKLTFHYDEDVVEGTIDWARSHKMNCIVSVGERPLDVYFQPSDLIVDRIVVRDACAVPMEADLRSEIDSILGRVLAGQNIFVDFAAYFVWEVLGQKVLHFR